MDATETRPPIPASLAHRPVRGGLAQPWANVELADGGVDFRSPHHARYETAGVEAVRCQSCGRPTGDPAVLVCGPRQILSLRFDEPPLCPPCALYVTKACPMVSGRTEVYPDRPRLSEGHRGGKCPEGCGCGGWQETDPEHSADQGGQPNLPWYACWFHPGDYVVTAHKIACRCGAKGCDRERLIVNGGLLNVPPLKIYLASEPGTGRIWRRLTETEAAEHATAALARIERNDHA